MQQTKRPASQADVARVLVLSCRGVRKTLFNSALYEFEDVIASVDSAELFVPRRYHGDLTFDGPRLANRMLRATAPQRSRPRVPYPAELTLDHEYDLLFAVFDNPWDLELVHLIKDVRARCRSVAAFMPEVWAKTFEAKMFQHLDFSVFDHFFIGTWHDVEPFARAAGVRCSAFTPAVDTFRFAPLERHPERVIDVTNLGRRSPLTHRALLDLARRGAFYLYDDVANGETPEPVPHREWLADILRRTRYSIANFARCDRPELTRGRREMGYRHVEGAASGTVLIGDPPETPQFREALDWTDALIPAPVDCAHIGDLIAELDRDADRVEAIRARNVSETLRRHDWCHRWAQVLDTLGLPHTEAMAQRIEYLHAQAARLAP